MDTCSLNSLELYDISTGNFTAFALAEFCFHDAYNASLNFASLLIRFVLLQGNSFVLAAGLLLKLAAEQLCSYNSFDLAAGLLN